MSKNKISAIIVLIVIVGLACASQIFRRTLHRLSSEFYYPFLYPVVHAESATLRESLLLKSKTKLIDELLNLKTVNEELAAELKPLRSAMEDKRRLEELLRIKPKPGFKCVFAEVYLRDPAFWYESFSINKGGSEGIKVGSIVVCRVKGVDNPEFPFGVVGRIIAVSEHSSQVETIFSGRCRLSVLLRKTKAPGILRGTTSWRGEPMVLATALPVFSHYSVGEFVVTSGLTKNVTPPDLLIGGIAGSDSPAVRIIDKLTAEVVVKPAVDFDSIRYLVVLVPRNENVIITH
ncbi:MAG: rod shape-determining protein MreC [Kiritimatiellaeota bacterium]|nr:rod shape-determining protein MreC [Kiritimatiellota bacterium]